MALQYNLERSLLRDLHNFEQSDLFSDPERAALAVAQAMSSTPPQVDERSFERLRAHFDSQQIVGILAIVGWENSRSRINHALALLPEGFFPQDHCPVLPGSASMSPPASHTP